MRHVCSLLILLSVLVSGCGGSQVSAQSAGLIPGTFFSTPPEEKEAQDGWVFATTGLALANTTTEAIQPFVFRITEATILTAEGKTYPAKVVGWRELRFPMLDKDLQFSFLPIYPGTFHTLYGRVIRTGEYALNLSIEYQYAQAAHPTDLQLQVVRPDLTNNEGGAAGMTLTIPLGVRPDLPSFIPEGQQIYSLTDLAAHLSVATDLYDLSLAVECAADKTALLVSVKNKNQLDNLALNQVNTTLSYQTINTTGGLWEIINQNVIYGDYLGPGQTAENSVELPAYSDGTPYLMVNGSVYSLMCQ